MIIKLIVNNKVHLISEKMANGVISIAKDKYLAQNVNAIVAIKKDDMVVLKKDVYEDTAAFEKEIHNWEHGGYTCCYVKAKGGN